MGGSDQERVAKVLCELLAPLHTSRIPVILTEGLSLCVRIPGAHFSPVPRQDAGLGAGPGAGWPRPSQPPTPARGRRGGFSSCRRRAEGCTARSAREAAAPAPAARLALRRGCPRRWVAEPALPASGARGPPAALPPFRARPAVRLWPSPRHPRGDRESLRFRRRCRSALKEVRWAAGPAPAAPPAATGGCRAGELGGDGAHGPGFPGASGRWAFLHRRPRAASAASPAPSRICACDRCACVCPGARVCARAGGGVHAGSAGECVCVCACGCECLARSR